MDDQTPQISDPTYQDRDIHIPIVMGIIVISLVVTALTFWWMKELFDAYDSRFKEAEAKRVSPLLAGRELPTEGLLQVDEAADLEAHVEEMDAKVNAYAWIDAEAGVVQIPVERAMELLLERGMPSAGSSAPDADEKPMSDEPVEAKPEEKDQEGHES